MKCWAPAASSSWFCFRVINVPLNSARPWAPVSLAFNAISQAGGGGCASCHPHYRRQRGLEPSRSPSLCYGQEPSEGHQPLHTY